MIHRIYLVILLATIVIFGLGCIEDSQKYGKNERINSITAGSVDGINSGKSYLYVEHRYREVAYCKMFDGKYGYPKEDWTFIIIDLNVTNHGYDNLYDELNGWDEYVFYNTKENPKVFQRTYRPWDCDPPSSGSIITYDGGNYKTSIIVIVPKNWSEYKIERTIGMVDDNFKRIDIIYKYKDW